MCYQYHIDLIWSATFDERRANGHFSYSYWPVVRLVVAPPYISDG